MEYVTDWSKYSNFKEEEFKCPCCGSIGKGISKSLVDDLQKLRNELGVSINITSGYRCSKWNKKVGGDTNSAHLTGQAVDFYLADGRLDNQKTRVALVNKLKKYPNYHYSYCNVNGNYPNMGSCIHYDTNAYNSSSQVSGQVAKLQQVLNSQYGLKLAVDNSFGPATLKACNDNYLCYCKNAPLHIKWLQTRLCELGYTTSIDGSFGIDTLKKLKKFQSDRGLVVDGYAGGNTHKELVK